jgi:hypothetical protein
VVFVNYMNKKIIVNPGVAREAGRTMLTLLDLFVIVVYESQEKGRYCAPVKEADTQEIQNEHSRNSHIRVSSEK